MTHVSSIFQKGLVSSIQIPDTDDFNKEIILLQIQSLGLLKALLVCYFSLICRISYWLMFHVGKKGYGWIFSSVLRRSSYMICQNKRITSWAAELFYSSCRNPKVLEGPWLKKSMLLVCKCLSERMHNLVYNNSSCSPVLQLFHYKKWYLGAFRYLIYACQ